MLENNNNNNVPKVETPKVGGGIGNPSRPNTGNNGGTFSNPKIPNVSNPSNPAPKPAGGGKFSTPKPVNNSKPSPNVKKLYNNPNASLYNKRNDMSIPFKNFVDESGFKMNDNSTIDDLKAHTKSNWKNMMENYYDPKDDFDIYDSEDSIEPTGKLNGIAPDNWGSYYPDYLKGKTENDRYNWLDNSLSGEHYDNTGKMYNDYSDNDWTELYKKGIVPKTEEQLQQDYQKYLDEANSPAAKQFGFGPEDNLSFEDFKKYGEEGDAEDASIEGKRLKDLYRDKPEEFLKKYPNTSFKK